MASKIPFIDHPYKNLPNFIIALTGQSNSQGYNTSYDPNNPKDQPNERIFGWNPNVEKWQIADLNTESLGWNYPTFKALGQQCSAFHFAKKLIEIYPNIRPGIINVGVSGVSIAFWTNWQPNDKYYTLTQNKLNFFNGRNTFPDNKSRPQGYIFDLHITEITLALNYLPSTNKIVNVICWDQGETDSELDYYSVSLPQVINRYKDTLKSLGFYNPSMFGFIAISTDGLLYTYVINRVNDILKTLNTDSDPHTRYVDATDLQVSILPGTTSSPDIYHYNSESQRIIGERCFYQYNIIFS